MLDSDKWRKVWDACLFVGSAAPAVLFGVTFANMFPSNIDAPRRGLQPDCSQCLLQPADIKDYAGGGRTLCAHRSRISDLDLSFF